MNRLEAEKRDGPLDGGDLGAASVIGAVGELEETADECGVVGDDVVELAGGAGGVVDGLGDLGDDFRQRGDGVQFADDVADSLLSSQGGVESHVRYSFGSVVRVRAGLPYQVSAPVGGCLSASGLGE
jgi:hypothetical protein